MLRCVERHEYTLQRAKKTSKIEHQTSNILRGGLAQLARALDLHSRGQGFDSLILHQKEGRRRKKKEEIQFFLSKNFEKRANSRYEADQPRKWGIHRG
jgi:hypothetical protein